MEAKVINSYRQHGNSIRYLIRFGFSVLTLKKKIYQAFRIVLVTIVTKCLMPATSQNYLFHRSLFIFLLLTSLALGLRMVSYSICCRSY